MTIISYFFFQQTSKQEIVAYFTHCGEVQSVNMSLSSSGTPKAEVVFTKAEAVDTAQMSRPHSLGGLKIETRRAAPVHLFGKPEEDMQSLRVFLCPPEGCHKGLHGLGEEKRLQMLLGMPMLSVRKVAGKDWMLGLFV